MKHLRRDRPQLFSARLLQGSIAHQLRTAFPLHIAPNAHTTTPDVVLDMALAATFESTFVNTIHQIHALPCPGLPDTDTAFYHLAKLSSQDVLTYFDAVNAWMLVQAKARGAFQSPVWIAFDEHRQPFYGQPTPWTTLGKKIHGTNQAHAVLSAEALAQGQRFTLALEPVTPFAKANDKLETALAAVRARRVPVAGVLLDRGFYAVDVLLTLEAAQVRYIVQTGKSKRVKAAIEACRDRAVPVQVPGGQVERVAVVHGHEVQSKTGSVETTLVLAYREDEDGKEEVGAWVTNAVRDVDEAAERVALYRKRWGIETGYRVKRQARGKTVSRSVAVRLLFLVLSFLVYNAWALMCWSLRDRGAGVGKPVVVFRAYTFWLARGLERGWAARLGAA